MNKIYAMFCALILGLLLVSGFVGASLCYAADKPDAKKLSDVETLKLQVAQKDLVIAQLQQQVIQLSAQVVQSKEEVATVNMTAAKDAVTKAHDGLLVQFKPDGTPFLIENPLQHLPASPSPAK